MTAMNETGSHAHPDRPSAGDRVPSLVLPLVNGEGSVDLAALTGRRFLLFFWASW